MDYPPRQNNFTRNRRPKLNIPLNDNIRARTLRVIDQEGNNLGEITRDEALRLAREAGLDLFVVSDKSDVPVARIVDYGKYKFEQSKKDKGSKKKQSGEAKEIKMGYNIGIGDYNTRIKHSKEFLDKGKRVKLNITLKGREIQHSELAKKLALRFIDDLMDHGTAEAVPERMVGRSYIVYIVPGADKVRVKKRKELLEMQEQEQNAKNPS